MQFFDFGNSETFYFFRWISESRLVSPNEMIAKAFGRAETDVWLKMGEDVSVVLKDMLAKELTDLLGDIEANYDPDSPWPASVNDSDYPAEFGEYRSLWIPLLVLSFDRIDCQRVAEALLIQAGKWNLSKEIPGFE
jgi:hypothetical protein